MRIFVHDYAGHPFAFELSRELARRGHVIQHAYFAADIGPKGQADRLPDDPQTFSIRPISIRQRYSKTDLVRRHLLDGAYGAAVGAAVMDFQPDIVLAANTPLNALIGLQRASRRSGARFVLWLQDVFGLAAGALVAGRWAGAGRLAAMHYEALERGILRRSDHIISIADAFLPYLARAGVPAERCSVVPNWGPLSLVSPRPKANAWSSQHGTEDKIVFTYTGTLGLKHNPHLLYDLAKSFAHRPDVMVHAAASGVGSEWLRNRQAEAPLGNLLLSPVASAEQFPDALGGSDVLVGLLEAKASAFSAPSKVLAYLCAGRPVLLSAPEENVSAQVLIEAKAGVLTPPGDTDSLVAAAHALAASKSQREACGAAARAYASASFAMDRLAPLFERSLGLSPIAGREAA